VTGAITIPLMKDGGYSPTSAGAIEAVASTGGQLMPPVMGAVAFLMAEDLDVEYRVVAMAALVPSFLYYAAVRAGRSGGRARPFAAIHATARARARDTSGSAPRSRTRRALSR